MWDTAHVELPIYSYKSTIKPQIPPQLHNLPQAPVKMTLDQDGNRIDHHDTWTAQVGLSQGGMRLPEGHQHDPRPHEGLVWGSVDL